mgnify:CR=1 FL=1
MPTGGRHPCGGSANPALGDFRSLEDMRIAAKRAQEIPAQENVFRRLFLNQWTEQADRWIALPAWEACYAPRAALEGRRCFVGMDLSTTTDLTALVAVFPGGDGFDVLAQCFLPADGLADRIRRDRVPYDRWAADGRIILTPGNVIDYEADPRDAARVGCRRMTSSRSASIRGTRPTWSNG